MWEARSGSTARSALRAKKARSALQFFFPAVFRSINGSGGRNERERRSRVASSPTVALALIGARAAPRGRVDRRGGRPRASLGAMPLTQITDVFDEPLDLWLSRTTRGSVGTCARMRSRPRAPRAPRPPRPAPRLNPPRTPTRRKRLPPPTPSLPTLPTTPARCASSSPTPAPRCRRGSLPTRLPRFPTSTTRSRLASPSPRPSV